MAAGTRLHALRAYVLLGVTRPQLDGDLCGPTLCVLAAQAGTHFRFVAAEQQTTGYKKKPVNPIVSRRVEIPPWFDLRMRGARFGEVRSVKDGVAAVKMDNTRVKRLVRVKVEDLKLV